MADNQLDLMIVNAAGAHGLYGELGAKLVAVEPPLWCRLIAGYVRDAGFTVKIIDAEALCWSPEEVARRVDRARPLLTCIAVYGHQPSASTQQMAGARAVARAIKSVGGPHNTIMVGGHVSALPVKTLCEELVNYACIGEGPVTIVDLLRYAKRLGPAVATVDWKAGSEVAPEMPSLADIPGLVWFNPGWRRDEAAVVVNPSAPLIDINKLHGNAWDLLPMQLYRAHNWQCFGNIGKREPYASIHTTLGCPYKCSFCCINAPFESNVYRMRNPKDVVSEILMLRAKHGVFTFKIVDEMFVLNEKHYTEICQGIIEAFGGTEHVDLNIWAYARIDTVKPHTLALLRRAGIRWLALGIESADPKVRDGARKQMRNDDIVGVVRAIQAADINVIGNYIFGLRDDSFITMGETFNLACELNTEFANFYSAMAYPGSPLYDQAVANDWTLPESWRGYSQHNDDCRPLDTKHVTGADVLRYRDDAFKAYFSRPRYLAMIREKFGPETEAHIHEMLGYNLRRKLLQEQVA